MNSKGIRKIFLCFLALLIAMSSFMSLAAVEKLPIDDKDELFLSHYIQPVAGEDYVYQVTLFVDALGEELHPPSLITFLLDGTSSMNSLDGGSNPEDARDAKTRDAVAQALRVMMSDENENKETTFINIAMFGSRAGGAVSLTRWASNPNATFSNLPPTYNDPNALQAANHLPGQASDYVPLLDPSDKTKLNPILAQLFYMDYDTLDLKTAAAFGTLDANYPISNMYFFGNYMGNGYNGLPTGTNSYLFSQRFPISSKGTYVDGGMSLVYDAMDKKMTELITSGDFKTEEMEKSKRYVMLLCDGDDGVPYGTESFAAAIKAPTTVTIHGMQYSGGGITPGSLSSATPATLYWPAAGAGRQLKGQNGEIWSIIIGNEGYDTNETTWQTNYLNGTFTGVSANVARNMISIAAAPVTNWTTLSTFNDVRSPSPSWINYYPAYMSSLDASKFGGQTHYLRTSDATEAADYFKDFAANALITGGSTTTVANVGVANDFDIYYTDKKYAPRTFSSISTHFPEIKITNNKLQWDIGTMQPQERVTLVYYIQLKPQYWGDELWHDPSSTLYINYNGISGGNFQINFPISYAYSAKKEDNTNTVHMNPVDNGNNPTTISAEDSFVRHTNSSTSNDIQQNSISGGAITAALQPYTASVPNTAKKSKKSAAAQDTCQIEEMDATATKKEKGKAISMNVSKVSVYEKPCKDATVMLYLAKNKQFKIAGVTENYYMIQYKKKDGKVYKGYILKKDVKVIS